MPKTAVKSKLRVERDNEFLREAPEVSIFLACYGMVEELRNLERAFRSSDLNDKGFFEEFNQVLTQLSQIAEATERFDVLLPVMDYGQFSPFFWRWFNWWDDYFRGLSPAQIAHIERLARERTRNVNDYRPEEHWLTYRHTPAFTLIPT